MVVLIVILTIFGLWDIGIVIGLYCHAHGHSLLGISVYTMCVGGMAALVGFIPFGLVDWLDKKINRSKGEETK